MKGEIKEKKKKILSIKELSEKKLYNSISSSFLGMGFS